jgi:hypothetical protein
VKVVWVTRSFLDYRVPVYAELSKMLSGEFRLVYCADAVPEAVRHKASEALGEGAIGLTGEQGVSHRNRGIEGPAGAARDGFSLRWATLSHEGAERIAVCLEERCRHVGGVCVPTLGWRRPRHAAVRGLVYQPPPEQCALCRSHRV